MQALIDFDGWRKWKDFSQNGASEDGKAGEGKKAVGASKKKKNRQSLGSQAGASNARLSIQEENEGQAA
jgi:osomolarity two-component system, response regulator SSK1